MPLLAAVLALVFAGPPAWIQRAGVPGPIVTWRAADVLGTPVVEGIVVNRDTTSHTVTVNVLGTRNALSNGTRVDVDAFLVKF